MCPQEEDTSARYCSTRLLGTRPVAFTSIPRDLAHSRTSLGRGVPLRLPLALRLAGFAGLAGAEFFGVPLRKRVGRATSL